MKNDVFFDLKDQGKMDHRLIDAVKTDNYTIVLDTIRQGHKNLDEAFDVALRERCFESMRILIAVGLVLKRSTIRKLLDIFSDDRSYDYEKDEIGFIIEKSNYNVSKKFSSTRIEDTDYCELCYNFLLSEGKIKNGLVVCDKCLEGTSLLGEARTS